MKKTPLPVSFLMLFTLSAPAHASVPATEASADRHWEFAGWEGGGCYPNVAFDPNVPDRVYLTSDVAGLWRSDDLGETWRFATRGLANLHVAVLAVAPSDSNVLYAGTADGVFVSRDAASSWQAADTADGLIRLRRPGSHRSIAVSAKDPARVVVGTAAGEVFASDDFGGHWTMPGDRRPFSGRSPITALSWLEDEGLLYASSAEGMAVFSFGEDRWRRLESGPKDVNDFTAMSGKAVRIYAAAGKRVFVSRDSGATWSAGTETSKGVFYRLLLMDAQGLVLLAARNDGWSAVVMKSADGGQTWEAVDKTLVPDKQSDPTRAWTGLRGRINALKRDPFHENVLFRTDWWGVWRSDDGGVTWHEKIKGAPNTVVSDVALSSDGEIYVATMDNGLLKSSNGGKTYTALFPVKGYSKEVNGHVWRAAVLGDRVLATSTPWESDWSQTLLSVDGGATFQRTRAGLPGKRPRTGTVWERGFARALASHPKRPDTVYLGLDGDDGGGFFVSEDGGKSWKRPKNQPGSLAIYNALAVDPEDPERLVWGSAAKAGGIFFSGDGGKNWRRAASPRAQLFDAAFGQGGTAYAAGSDERHEPSLYVSRDKGSTWRLLKKFDGSGSAEALCPLPDGRLAVGTVRWNSRAPGRIYLSSPDQTAWEEISGDLPEGDGPAALAYDQKRKTLYLGRTAGSVYKAEV